MPSLITCTPGGSTDNSYLTLAQATAVFGSGLRASVWAEWTTMDRERALIEATSDIEGLGGSCSGVNTARRSLFPGSPYQGDRDLQALHFPRSGDLDDDATTKVIPAPIRAAVCEQAFWLLYMRDNPGLVDFRALVGEGVSSIGVDGLSASMKPTGIPAHIAPRAWDAIKPFVRRAFSTTVGGGGYGGHPHRG
jgi:hypothetical protein